MKIFVSPHYFSDGAKLLAKKIGATQIKVEGSNYHYKNDHIVINWGSSQKKPWFVDGIKMLNAPDNVAIAVDKIKTLTKLKSAGISVPEFTTDINTAKGWINSGGVVVCRTKTKSSGGDGIVIAESLSEIVNAPLYTLYKKKKYEYRVAVVDGVVIDYMQKKKDSKWNTETQGEVDYMVRSHNRGWIMAREDINVPQSVLDLAVKSVKCLGLDFASVDIIRNETENLSYVLEVNTAPGLEEGGTSLERYSNAFLKLLNNQPITALKASSTPQVANQITSNNPTPTPTTTAAPAAVPAPAPAISIPTTNTQGKNYVLDGLSDIKISETNGTIKISGRVAGIVKPIKVLEIQNNKVSFWFQDED